MPTVLSQMLKLGKVPSSLLLIGASQEEALNLAKELLGKAHSAKIDSGNHPDLHLYLPEGKSELHPTSSIQKLIREMAFPPFEAEVKIFIIIDAEKMLPSASNALLKVLEEPNEDTYFLLVSNEPNKLLPTILSRLHPLSFVQEATGQLDLSPLFEKALAGDWVSVLDELSSLSEEEPEPILEAYLHWIAKKKDPALFQKALALHSRVQTALVHNVKFRTVLLHLLLEGI